MSVPFWLLFTRLHVRGAESRHPRVFITANCGTRGRAQVLLRRTGGRRRGAVVYIEGRRVVEGARALGYPDRVVDALAGVVEMAGKPGVARSEEQIDEQKARVRVLKEVVARESRRF